MAEATLIAILHYHQHPPWSAQQLIQAAEKQGHRAEYLRIQGLDAEIKNGIVTVKRHGEPVAHDAFIVRGIASSPTIEQYMKRIGVLYAAEKTGITVINTPLSIMIARDKWLSLLILASSGIPVPDTLVTENPYQAMRYAEQRGTIVSKPLIGSLGMGSTMITSPDIAYLVARTLQAHKHPAYLQEYIEKPGYDIRVFVVGGEAVAAIKRRINTGWKTNIARGARPEPVKPGEEQEAIELAIRAAEALKLDYTGVDIVVDKEGKHYVIEANTSPLWRGLMTATGINPAIHIIKHVVSKTHR